MHAHDYDETLFYLLSVTKTKIETDKKNSALICQFCVLLSMSFTYKFNIKRLFQNTSKIIDHVNNISITTV